MKTFGDLRFQSVLRRALYTNSLNEPLNQAARVPAILHMVETHSDWDIFAQLLKEPTYLKYFEHDPFLYNFYKASQGPMHEFLGYLCTLEPAALLAHQADGSHLALCYLHGGVQALEFLLTYNEPQTQAAQLHLASWLALDGHLPGLNRLLKNKSHSCTSGRLLSNIGCSS